MNIIAMIHNQKLDRYHPVIFRDYPHSADTSTMWRFKSSGHHTSGFETRQDALDNIHNDLVSRLDMPLLKLDYDYEWDGLGIPALVQFFDIQR